MDPAVLDTLAQHRVPATFFLVGAQVRRHADVVRGRLGEHEVGNHSWKHRDLAQLDADEAYDDLSRSHDAIAEVTGRVPRLLRPPYGHLGGAVLHAAARLNYRLVLWSLQMAERSFPTTRPGTPGGSWPTSGRGRSCSGTTWVRGAAWSHWTGYPR
ncbi:hypothetical protein GCM10027614_35390 [Micromonospora vulcania]